MGRSRKSDGPVTRKRFSKKRKLEDSSAAWGPEPTWNDVKIKRGKFNSTLMHDGTYDGILGYSLNWYNAMCTDEELKKWALEYITQNPTSFPADTVERLSTLPDRLFTTIGALARCAMRGAILKEPHSGYMLQKCKELTRDFGKVIVVKLAPVARKIDSIQSKLIEEIEFATDSILLSKSIRKFNFPKLVKETGASATQVRGVIKRFAPRVEEIQKAIDGEDKIYSYNYSNYHIPILEKLVKFYGDLEEGLAVAPKVERKPRKPRKKKAKSAEKILKKFACMNSCSNFGGLQSISANDILGAKELWTFDTKKRKLCKFIASEETGLTVSGTSIRSYNEEESFWKKLRKPDIQLKEILRLPKIALKKYVEAIRCKEGKLRSRINEEMILLRVF